MDLITMVLIPKEAKLVELTQFRPISYYNFVYKIIVKVMVNRLKPYMEKLITQNQCAFLEKRQIQDNILIANEACHHMKLKKMLGYGACFWDGPNSLSLFLCFRA